MKRKYVVFTARKAADIDHGADAEAYLSRTVHEPEPMAYNTGILDAAGNPIMAIE